MKYILLGFSWPKYMLICIGWVVYNRIWFFSQNLLLIWHHQNRFYTFVHYALLVFLIGRFHIFFVVLFWHCHITRKILFYYVSGYKILIVSFIPENPIFGSDNRWKYSIYLFFVCVIGRFVYLFRSQLNQDRLDKQLS